MVRAESSIRELPQSAWEGIDTVAIMHKTDGAQKHLECAAYRALKPHELAGGAFSENVYSKSRVLVDHPGESS